MADTQRCPTCGGELPAGAPAGLCPACLLRAGATSDHVDSTRPPTASFVPPTPAELAPHFPQLQIQELIGRGGMGAVYKARQSRLDRLVALKILPKSIAVETGFTDRFAREATAMARLSHPNIIAIHDFGEAGGWFYFVMEFVEGANLRQALRAGPISPKDALAIVGEICDALQYAHEEGVVHRDIKPENILLGRKGRVKIADFGLAKLLGTTTIDRHLTATHQVMGTLGYMAPEQMEGTKSIDHRADLYALGVVFYELLTGELPIGRFAPPSQKVQIDVRLDEVVLKSLEKERERRYQSASQIKHDVERITTAPADETAASRMAPPSDRDSSRLNWLGVSLLVLGVLEIVLGAACLFDASSQARFRYSGPTFPIVFAVVDYLVLSPLVILAGLLTLVRRFRALAILGSFVALLPIASFGTMIDSPQPDVSDFVNELQRFPRDGFDGMNLKQFASLPLVNRWPTVWLGVLGVPIGMWGLIELNRPGAKAAFRWNIGSIWRAIYPRYLNSTLLGIAIGGILIIPVMNLDWIRLQSGGAAFSATMHGPIIAGMIGVLMLVLFVTWTAGMSNLLWRSAYMLGTGLAILGVAYHYYSVTWFGSRRALSEGYYSAVWAGVLFSILGAWQLAMWLRVRNRAIS